MPIYPRARVRLIDRYRPGGSAGGAMPTCHRLVLHTAVSAAPSLFDFFNRPGNPVAHFYVVADGSVEQYVNTDRRSAAVLNGNHDAISVETQDKGGPFPEWSGSNVPAWTKEQVRALAEIAVRRHRHHDIPLHRLYSSRPGRKVSAGTARASTGIFRGAGFSVAGSLVVNSGRKVREIMSRRQANQTGCRGGPAVGAPASSADPWTPVRSRRACGGYAAWRELVWPTRT